MWCRTNSSVVGRDWKRRLMWDVGCIHCAAQVFCCCGQRGCLFLAVRLQVWVCVLHIASASALLILLLGHRDAVRYRALDNGGCSRFVRESMEVLSLILIHPSFDFANSLVNR